MYQIPLKLTELALLFKEDSAGKVGVDATGSASDESRLRSCWRRSEVDVGVFAEDADPEMI